MKFFFGIFALIFSAVSAHAQDLNASCVNPLLSVQLVEQGVNARGLGQASSPKIQFNINTPPGAGVIFVDDRNNGVCTITVSDGYRLLAGRGVIDPTDMATLFNSGYKNGPSVATMVYTSCIKQEVNILKCQVIKHPDGNKISDPKGGTINLNWIVEYEEAR